MSGFFDTIQEDENARQSARPRAYPANPERSALNMPSSQLAGCPQQHYDEQEDDHEDFLREYRAQQERRWSPAPGQRYASQQNLGSSRRQLPGHGEDNSRYASQASISTTRNPYFERATQPKAASSNYNRRPVQKSTVGWDEEEDEEGDEYTLADRPQLRQASRAAAPQQQQPQESVPQRNSLRNFTTGLRQALEEDDNTSRGRNERTSATAGPATPKPTAPAQFADFGSDDEYEEGTGPRQPNQPHQKPLHLAAPPPGGAGYHGSSSNYTPLGHQGQQQERSDFYGSTRNRDGLPSSRRDPRERREKFKPEPLHATELFDENMHIQKGIMFDEIFGNSERFEVQVTGGDDTKPKIESFDVCDFSPQIMKNLKLLKYSCPTPIQKHVIPLVQHKKTSILGNAETGSGKTAAFIVPIINEIQRKKSMEGLSSKGGLPYCLVLEPTRDLAEQVNRDTRAFANQTGVVITVTYGETNIFDAKREIERGCDILIMTIGRLQHFIQEGIVKLNNVRYLVLDEADKLLKRDFEKTIVELVIQNTDLKRDYRTFLFSATIDEDVQNFIAQHIRTETAFFVSVGEVNHAAPTIDQKFVLVKKYEKEDFLLELLKDSPTTVAKPVPGNSEKIEYVPERTVVFVAQKRQSDRVAINLAREGFNVISLNADRTAKQRWEAIYKFKMNTYQVLVATDVASRGLNMPKVEHVINLDLPIHEQMSYIHRIGRTGRAGNAGHATSFFDPNSQADIESAPFYARTLKLANMEVPDFMQEIVDSRQETAHELNRVSRRNTDWD